MKFWDASAIVPLLMSEPATRVVQALAAKDPTMIVGWATAVECAAAIARLERDAALDEAAVTRAFDRLKQLADSWHEIDPSGRGGHARRPSGLGRTERGIHAHRGAADRIGVHIECRSPGPAASRSSVER
jgi:hypothetical protein